MVLYVLLGTSVTQAEDYREIELNSIRFVWSQQCERRANELNDIIQYYSNDGGSLIISNMCKYDYQGDKYSNRLDSTIRTNLKRGSYSLGNYCVSDQFIESYRRSLALLSNREAQVFIIDNSKKLGCVDNERRHITIRINLR